MKPKLKKRPTEVYKLVYTEKDMGKGYIPDWWLDSELHEVTTSNFLIHDFGEHNPRNRHPNPFADEVKAIGGMMVSRVDQRIPEIDDIPRLDEDMIETLAQELKWMFTKDVDGVEGVLENFCLNPGYPAMSKINIKKEEEGMRFLWIAEEAIEGATEVIRSEVVDEDDKIFWNKTTVAQRLGMKSANEFQKVVAIHLANGAKEFRQRFAHPVNGGYDNVNKGIFSKITEELGDLNEIHNFATMLQFDTNYVPIEIMVHINTLDRTARCYMLKEEFEEFNLYDDEKYEMYISEEEVPMNDDE